MKIKKIATNKNFFQIISGVLLICLVFILNGFLSFITVGFDFSKLSTSEYWANFAIMNVSEMAVMFGMYLIQKIKDLQNKKITDLQNEINTLREVVYTMDKVTSAEDWLREVYNYKEKLIIYENKIKYLYEHLQPKEPSKEEKGYNRKLLKYELGVEQKKYLLEQLDFIKKDKERLKLIVEKASNGEIDKLEKELDCEQYGFKTAKIHYKDVYWGHLLSDMEESDKKGNSAFFNEKGELSKNFIKFLGMGLVSSAFISALVFPSFTAIGWEFLLNLIINLITLSFFMIRGIGLSKKIILGKYYKSLEKRKSIYNKMLKDLGLSNVRVRKDNEQESL